MINEEAKEIIENNPVAFATIDHDGHPNVIAVAYVKVADDKNIIITDNYMQTTKDNILRSPNVCLAVWDKEWKGYKIKGVASYYTEGKWFDFIKSLPENKDCPAKGAILIEVSEIIELQ